jgi:3-phenylpropionate/cinnamic acid dioxygenase small subunit
MSAPQVDRNVCDEVEDVLVRYATGIDRRDWTLFRSCFTEDCEADYGDIGVWHGAHAITAWMEHAHAACGYSLHRITNIVVSRGGGRGVTTRSYVDALVMDPDNQIGSRAVGFYDDELMPTDGGWKIARRCFTPVRASTRCPVWGWSSVSTRWPQPLISPAKPKGHRASSYILSGCPTSALLLLDDHWRCAESLRLAGAEVCREHRRTVQHAFDVAGIVEVEVRAVDREPDIRRPITVR